MTRKNEDTSLVFEIRKDGSNLELFDRDYVQKLTANNVMLEKIVNYILQNEHISQETKQEILEYCGTDCLHKFADMSYGWKGL